MENISKSKNCVYEIYIKSENTYDTVYYVQLVSYVISMSIWLGIVVLFLLCPCYYLSCCFVCPSGDRVGGGGDPAQGTTRGPKAREASNGKDWIGH